MAADVGIYLLQPPQHNASGANLYGQAYLANAQNFWLNGSYNPDATTIDPSPADEQIDADVITAAQAGWANVASQLPADASPYELALEAQDLANEGYLVVANVLGNQGYTPGPDVPPPGGPGHIAVIMPANLTQSQLTNLGPAEAQSGSVNYNLTNIAIGFQGHLADPSSFLQSIGATTSYTDPMIQFFYNTDPLNIPAASASA